MSKALVLYHAGCWDGFCAAWVWRTWRDAQAEFVPVQYNQDPPAVDGRRVVILDFSYPRAVLERMAVTAASLLVIDHHKTAAEALSGLPYCRFDMGKSGGRLTWEFLHESLSAEPDPWAEPVPWLVAYTEDRDLWRHALPDSQEVNASLRSHPLDFALWDRLHKQDPAVLVLEGTAIRRRERQIIDEHVRHAVPVELDGFQGAVVNATVLFSEIAGELAQGRDFGACWFQRKDGKRAWSLRSRDGGCDVSAIAKARGGGGHVQAAGFEEG